ASAFGKLTDMASVDLVSGKPLDIVNIKIDFCFTLNSRFDFFVKDLSLIFIEFFRKDPNDAKTLFAFERKKNNERILCETDIQRLVAEASVNLSVCNVKRTLERA